MKHCFIVFVLVVYGVTPLDAWAYELGTHSRLTYHAYLQSTFGKDNQTLRKLGLHHLDPGNAFGTSYYDISGQQVETRFARTFSESERRMPDGVHSLSLEGWLLRGAIREDDWTGVSIPGVCEVRGLSWSG